MNLDLSMFPAASEPLTLKVMFRAGQLSTVDLKRGAWMASYLWTDNRW